jgi:hypothetical protein
MSKLRSDLRIALAGVCCGLFGVSVFLLAERVNSYYEYLTWLMKTDYVGGYNRGVEDLWWVPLVLGHVVLSIVASLLVHRYLTSGRVSPFLRWQGIGMVALAEWGLLVFVVIGSTCLIRGTLSPLEHLWIEGEVVPISQFVASVFAANVLFGSAVQAASAPDTRER